MIFQAKLGSYADKTARVTRLAQSIGGRIGAGADITQAAELAKADLMTAMVGEFPELQGTMGRYYAEAEGLAAAIGARPSRSIIVRALPAMRCPRQKSAKP